MQVKIPTYLRKMGEAHISNLFALFCSLPGSRLFKGAAITQSKDVSLAHSQTQFASPDLENERGSC